MISYTEEFCGAAAGAEILYRKSCGNGSGSRENRGGSNAMQWINSYSSPMGELLLAADDVGLTGLWFAGQKYYAAHLEPAPQRAELPVFDRTKQWLDLYFSGQEPDFMPELHLIGTPFQRAVWEILRQIPYGETTTYGAIAKRLAGQGKAGGKAAQAVGGAVGHNRISVIVPCHRVVGSNGSLTGYAGGIEKKIRLLRLERVDIGRYFVPETEAGKL